MPRGFTHKEKEQIERRLLESGRRLFGKYGLKKTGIRDLTSSTGISQGSFYSFFSSKEELFFVIIEEEEKRIKEELLPLLEESLTSESMKMFLKKAFTLIKENPLLKTFFVDDTLLQVSHKLPDQKIEEHIQQDTHLLLPFIKRWQGEGRMKRIDPHIISSLFRALFLLSLHRKEIGLSVYEETIELFIDCLVEGLIQEPYREGDNDDCH